MIVVDEIVNLVIIATRFDNNGNSSSNDQDTTRAEAI